MDLHTAIKGYADTRKRQANAWNQPKDLGDIAERMGTYASYIADHLGDMKVQYEEQRASKYLKYIKEGKTSTAAENQARSELAKLKGEIARLELIHRNAWSLVSVIQSHIKTLNNKTFS